MAERMKWIEVIMPQLAESLVSATIGKWLKKPGDRVEQYEPICEVITDKVNAEIPSTVDGIMGELLVEEGTTIAVGEVICRMQVAASDEEAAEQVTQVSQQQEQVQQHTSPHSSLPRQIQQDMTRTSRCVTGIPRQCNPWQQSMA